MRQSRVYLVGAGPGDPELLTLKGRRVLGQAEVVVYDRLVGDGVLDFVNPDAELVFVGKEASSHTKDQEEINSLLVKFAMTGRQVVRLKGGDPYIFGRGGEEATFLKAAGIPFEVVPGVTAAAGVAAYAGIPLTDRRFSSAVTFVTGHRSKNDDLNHLDWKSLGGFDHTIVFYMGVSNLPLIVENLMKNGKPGSTPAAVVRSGTMPGQKTFISTLESIADTVRENVVRPPALLIIGNVVCLGEMLNWFEAEAAADEAAYDQGEIIIDKDSIMDEVAVASTDLFGAG